MKTTIKLLLVIIVMVNISCNNNNSIAPANTASTTTPAQTNKCQTRGICAEGWYQVIPDSSIIGDTAVYQTGTNILGHCKLTYFKTQQNPYTAGPSHDSLVYMFTDFDFNTNILTTDTLYTHRYLYPTQGPINYWGVVTKTWKPINMNFDHY